MMIASVNLYCCIDFSPILRHQIFYYIRLISPICFFLGAVNLPPPRKLPHHQEGPVFPYTLLRDEAFPLRPYLMRPYPGRAMHEESHKVFNFRLSHARRVVENCFGELTLPNFASLSGISLVFQLLY